MSIRQVHEMDTDALIALWRAAGLGLPTGDLHAEIAHKLTRDANLFLVGEKHGRIIATVMGSYDGRRGWINRLAVLPDVQKRGLGHQLLAEVERRMRAKGCTKVNLLIEPKNARAQQFYQQFGYQTNELTNELIFMEKWLNEC